MLGGSVYLNNRRRVVFSETPGTPYNDLHHREFANLKDTTLDTNVNACAKLC